MTTTFHFNRPYITATAETEDLRVFSVVKLFRWANSYRRFVKSLGLHLQRGMIEPEEENTKISRNVGSFLCKDTTSHPKRFTTSTQLLSELHVLKKESFNKQRVRQTLLIL